jgi:hypothetical protein
VPAAQAVHDFPPVAVSVSVTKPAPQSAQSTVEAALYLPAAHAVHVLAPVAVSVLVTEPAAQVVQPVFVVPVLYVPAAHAVHVDLPVDVEPVEDPAPQSAQAVWESGLYLPAAHAVHVLAPVAVSVLVTEPAAQVVQPVFVVPMLYVPEVHAVQLVAPVPDTPVEEPDPQSVQEDAPAAE